MKTVVVIEMVLMILFLFGPIKVAHAQAAELAQLALNIQKLNQFRTILSNMKKGYQIVSKGYSTVKNLSQGNFSLHETFLNGLLTVSPAVAKYKRIPAIIQLQKELMGEYKNAITNYKSMSVFSVGELSSMEKVYGGIFNSSVQNLEELLMVVTSGKLRMSDAERITAIDRIYFSMKDKSSLLRGYNFNFNTLARQRRHQLDDLDQFSNLYGQ